MGKVFNKYEKYDLSYKGDYVRPGKDEWLKHYGTATVGERGQIVLPIEARKKFKISQGEKLLVLGSTTGNFERVILMKSEAVTGLLNHLFDVEKFLEQGGMAGVEKILKQGIEKTKMAKEGIKKEVRKK